MIADKILELTYTTREHKWLFKYLPGTDQFEVRVGDVTALNEDTVRVLLLSQPQAENLRVFLDTFIPQEEVEDVNE